MKSISRRTLELILKTFESSSKDETRVNLNSVRLGNSNDGLVVESTDGHILTRHFIEEEDISLEECILIDVRGKSKLKTFLTSNKNYKSFLIDLDVENNRNLRILTTDQRDGVILPTIFRDYPKTDAIIPKITNEDDYLEVGINPSLLVKLYKSMNGNERTAKVKLKIKKSSPSLSPILVESGNNNLGIIMPVKF